MVRVKKGLELEYFVVDENFSPNRNMYYLAENLNSHKITHEFGPYQFEIITDPTVSYNDLEQDIKESISIVREKLPNNFNMLSMGAYPLQFNPEVSPDERLRKITDKTNNMFNFEKYRGVELETALQSFQMNFSLLDSNLNPQEQIIYLNNILIPTIPIIVALTANSSYFMGGRVSNPLYFDNPNLEISQVLLNGRRHIWERCEGKGNLNCTNLEGFGIPRKYSSFEDYLSFLTHFGGMGNPVGIESQLYVDIRPRTEDKSGRKFLNEEIRVEYRAADMLPTIKENLGVSALLEGYILSCIDGNNVLEDFPLNREELESLSFTAGVFGLCEFYNGKPLRRYVENMFLEAEKYLDVQSQGYLNSIKPLISYSRSEEQIKMGSKEFMKKIINEFNEM